ncbi:MAG: hypothetical protein INR71_15230 [Terriglobus roseus]|nr:hypothetical protein [Terriglobus roseus]
MAHQLSAGFDGGHQGIDPATGALGVSVKDPTTNAYTIKYYDTGTGKDITQQVTDAGNADASKKPVLAVNDDGTIKFPAGN